MRFSVVINTCALQPGAATHVGQSGKPYGLRAGFLRDLILPRLRSDTLVDQIIVVGEFEPGEGYTYVSAPSRYRNCRDVLHQRQAGTERIIHDRALFLMDDHVPGPGFFELLAETWGQWDVVSPVRVNRAGTILNSGWNGVGANGMEPERYIHAHGTVLARWVWERCPWGQCIPIYKWDQVMSMWWADAGARAIGTHQITLTDVEE